MISRFAHKAVSIGAALAMAMSLVGSAFAEETIASTTQSAANVAQVVQTGSVSSGDAVAGPGAKATTGNVKVEAKVDVSQKISQDADTSATGGGVASTDQSARNTANVSQRVIAGSGDAVADGHNAQASTGDVYVTAKVDKDQEIDQEADAEAEDGGLAAVVQTATNTDIVLQAVFAQSGDAAASGPWAKAKTGNVYATAEVEDDQDIDQDADADADEGAIADIEQTASQTINAQQGLRVESGTAVASVTKEDKEADSASLVVGWFPHFWDLAVAETGDVYATAEIEQDQDIDQDADADAEEDGIALVAQAAFNTSIADQFATVFSGDAAAFVTIGEQKDGVHSMGSSHSGTKAWTGDVYAEFDIDVYQDIDQDADADAEEDGIAVVDQDVDADAANYSAAIQGSTNGAFSIWVYSGNAVAFGSDWDGSWAWSGDVGSWWCPVEFEIDVYQDIDQDADTFAGDD